MKILKTILAPKATTRLGVIGLEVKDKNGIGRIAKAPCDVKVEKDKKYNLSVWGIGYIKCPYCFEHGRMPTCNLCGGLNIVLSFHYTLKDKNKIIAKFKITKELYGNALGKSETEKTQDSNKEKTKKNKQKTTSY